MTLVERLFDLREWTDSRKLALTGAQLFVAIALMCGFVLILQPEALDVRLVVWLLSGGAAVAGAFGAAGWVALRRGQSGRSLTYIALFTYQAWVVVFTFAVGGFTSPLLIFPMLIPLSMAILFDVRTAAVSAGYVVTLLVAGGVLSLSGAVPFAPAMQIRDIDGLNTASWLAVAVTAVLLIVVVSYLVVFAAVAALDLQHRRLESAHNLIRRYVPEQVADAVVSGAPEGIERHERRKLTVFFSDLVGFTDLSDELEPEDLALILSDYFTEMAAIAERYGGTVDDLVGDAILIFFGAPGFTDDRDHAQRAVRMALDMQKAMGPLNERWAAAGIPETLRVRMGINTGVATVGNFGSASRTKYTALGKQVNIAARIQTQCEPGKVLLGHSTWLLVRNDIACADKGELTLKGLRRPMPAYEVQV
jgi:class 3 adenylate cyclase